MGPNLEVAQGALIELLLGYSPLDVAWGPYDVVAFHLSVVSLVGGANMLNISASFFRAGVCLFPNVVSGIVGVGLRRTWVR